MKMSQPKPCAGCCKPAVHVCALCRVARFCSKECAVQHWPVHREACFENLPPPYLLTIRNLIFTDSGLLGHQQANVKAGPIAEHNKQGLPGNGGAGHFNGMVAEPPMRLPVSSQSQSRPATSVTSQEPSGSRAWEQFETLSDTEFTKVLVISTGVRQLWVSVYRNEDMINRLHSDLKVSSPLFGSCLPSVGQCFAGCYQGQWCRVKLVAVVPTLTVHYIDYGNVEPINMKDLRALPQRFMDIPAQAIRIQLVDADDKKYSLYKVDTEMVIKRQAVAQDGTVEVVIKGEEKPPAADQLKPVVPVQQKPVEFPVQQLPADRFSEVCVLESCQDSYVVNLNAMSNTLLTLGQQLTRSVARLPAVTAAPRVGDLVAAEFTDDSGPGWYRACVLSASPPFRVLFIDFGNESAVPADRVHLLPAEFATLPAQAVPIKLAAGTATRFHGLPVYAIFRVRAVGKADGFAIVEPEDTSAPSPTAPRIAFPTAREIAPGTLPTDRYVDVTVTEPVAGGYYVTVDVDKERCFEQVIKLGKLAATLPRCQPSLGETVAAQFCGDWYRGRVTQLQPLTVFYLDYGNTEPVAPDDLRELPTDMYAMPAQAVKVALAPGSPPVTATEIRVKAVGRQGDAIVVSLEGDNKTPLPAATMPSVPSIDKPAPSASNKRAMPAATATAVVVLSSSGETAWVTPAEDAERLQDFHLALAADYPQMRAVADDLAVGAVVAVMHKRAVCRAEVVAITGPKAELRFLDDGVRTTVDKQKLRSLPSNHLAVEPQAIQVQFEDPHLQVEDEQELTLTPVGKTSEGVDVVRVIEGNAQLPCLHPATVVPGTRQEVFFVHRDSVFSYVQMTAQSNLLLSLSDSMKESALRTLPTAPTEGSAVLVLFEGEWARATVLTTRPSIQVRFLDYGNVATAAAGDIRAMSADAGQTPALCWKVRLSEDTPAAVVQLGDFAPFPATFVCQADDGTWIIRGGN